MDKEIRFAVVMYGGVSLAIYINGVAQELLKMSKATNMPRNKYRKSTEIVYRIISYLLSNEDELENISKDVKDYIEAKDDDERVKIHKKIYKLVKNSKTQTKFIVDILSGTSAGGINSIYLAKALANNQEMDKLKDLWISEGDVATLLNDNKSVIGTKLTRPNKPKSLLNTRRLYLKLLEAFNEMEDGKNAKSTHVDELDLFVTTTDFHGVVAPIRLLDDVVFEKRFRQVFNFRYDKKKKKNDFLQKHNPMMAFAARCTSAFPFAFEPMNKGEAESVIDDSFAGSRAIVEQLESDIKRFMPKIIDNELEEVNWLKRDFVDGGVLDNKPFSYVVDVLSARRSDYKGKRKLLYIEPSPEQFRKKKTKNKEGKLPTPNALLNAKAAISDLPMYETIREDLERLISRNKIVGRVNRLIFNAEKDIYNHLLSKGDNTNEKYFLTELSVFGKYIPWEQKGLNDLVELRDISVLPYYRLRILTLSDDIARSVARNMGIDEKSEYFAALRELVFAWRRKNFSNNKVENNSDIETNQKAEQETVLMFLKKFDLDYRIRRLKFVLQKSEELRCFDEGFQNNLKIRCYNLKKYRDKKLESKTDKNKGIYEKKLPTELLWEHLGENGKDYLATNEKKEIFVKFQKEIGKIQVNFEEVLTVLQTEKEKLNLLDNKISNFEKEKKDETNQNGNLSEKDLKKLLEIRDVEKHGNSENWIEDKENIDSNLASKKKANENVYNQIKYTIEEFENEFERVFEKQRKKINGVFNKRKERSLVGGIQGYLRQYYVNFDYYDQLSFPIYYQTGVGESSEIEVMRISPQDAKGLVDEKKDNKQKLAGESLFHFGAMLDPVWRQNDIMWGRLDGAERIITALLPETKNEDLRKDLTKMAHLEILQDEVLNNSDDYLTALLTESLVNLGSGLSVNQAIEKATKESANEIVKNKVKSVLESSLERKHIYEYFKNEYKYNEKLEPKPLLQTVSRSTKITGDVLDGVAKDFDISGSKLRWVARLGQIFWGLIEIAAPNSFWNALFNQWLMILYFFEVLTIVASTILVKPDIQQFGIICFILTLIIHLASVALNDFMRGGKLLSLLKVIAGGVLGILSIAGAIFFYAFFYDVSFWEQIAEKQALIKNYSEWQRLLPISLVFVLFIATLAWREANNINIKAYGKATLLYAVLLLGFTLTFGWMTSGAKGLNGLEPVLALEFVQSPQQVFDIVGEVRNPARLWMKYALIVDSFLFVPLYTGFLLFFSWLIDFRRSRWTIKDSRWYKKRTQTDEEPLKIHKEDEFARFIEKAKNRFLEFSFLKLAMLLFSILIIIAGFADLLENYFSYWLMETSKQDTKSWMLYGVNYSAKLKWFLLSFIVGVLSLVFWRGKWWKLLSVGFAVSGIIGFVGLFYNFQVISVFLITQFILCLIVGFIFSFWYQNFKRA